MRALQRFWINGVAAHPVWSLRARALLMRMGGAGIKHVAVYPHLHIEGEISNLRIARGCGINANVTLDAHAPITMDANVGLAYGVCLVTASHTMGPSHDRWGIVEAEPITIGAGTWVGANVVILPGVTIGAGCMIAAGAIVTKDCEPNTLYGGIPAKPLRSLDAD
ncbi:MULTISPECIES: acyltransferase [Rhodococcus]|uniref:Acyltransferase n=1 Tax=Rhodococcus cerastii TaxID=908616 RepID=A0ABU4D3X0_9NOCA|nr:MULTISPECIES: acyltransferase [Rhodococcus]MDV6304413.1 acyltransferase [Rhodococcus cerastii]MDV7991251.1 acyltransferase [Rhodococcus sp. IEGM 1374]MDV8077530.1 acyltransferase [Rhodococcus sp. IEGM 1370]